MSEATIALLVAAGTSERMGGRLPKPYLQIGSETLMKRTVKAFLSHPQVSGVRVVIRREHHPLYKRAIEPLTLFPCVIGGNTRQESVLRGLESIAHRHPRKVLVHDIARPLASRELISRVIDALDTHDAVIPSLPVTDTVRRSLPGQQTVTIDRSGLYMMQTPQGFRFDALFAAHQRHKGGSLTDDAALIEADGGRITLVEGEYTNLKITTPSDIARMQQILEGSMETRTGMGYDVHQLRPHDPETPATRQYIKLCGIKIPFEYYLKGHSDADVGLHALVDAILGAIGAGDIGMHFPPDDPKWQGADSERFLLHAYELLHARGGELSHLDVTLIGERPKIAPWREQMVSHIAQTLKIHPGRVSVKATTTEKLGFAGRGEGIAAQAVATVKLPLILPSLRGG